MPKKKLKLINQKVRVPKTKIKYRHYGKKIELLIDEACKLKKEEIEKLL